jgi:uncharacterized protein (DUF1501 family)
MVGITGAYFNLWTFQTIRYILNNPLLSVQQNAIDSSNNLFWAQQRGNVSTVFPSTDVGNQLKLVAEMINSNDCRKSDRDVFYIEVPGFDHHDSVLTLLQSRFEELNDGLSAFVSEMKLKNKWNDITVVSTSDFGR